MEAVDHLNRRPKELLDGRGVCLGHIQPHDFNAIAFGLRATLEPGDHILSPPTLEGGNGSALVQVDDRGVVTVSLASSILIDPNGLTQLAGTSASTALKGPAKHGALGQTVAPGQLAARTTTQKLGSHLSIEALRPFDS